MRWHRKHAIPSLLGLVLGAATALAACGDDGETSTTDTATDAVDDTSEVVDLTGKSVYHLEFTIDEQPIVIDRDLTGLDQYFSFGSTHIAPAVSFAVTDNLTAPRTMIITLNFGIVVPSDDHAIQTDGTGVHAFSAGPPDVDVFVKGLTYRSTVDGSSGEIDISDWGTEVGDTVAGTFHGTLVAEGPTGRSISVTGSFHFTLPARQDGQPGG